jgi:hypothetical protein
MARTGRNQPCACGSGRKTKRCCGTTAGPPPEQQARAWLHAEARRWDGLLVDYSDADITALVEELLYLPGRDLSLHLPLPRVLPPALERVRTAAATRHPEAAVEASWDALPVIDTPLLRAHLARGVLALHDDDRIASDQTAVAILDLARSDPSFAVLGSVIHTFAVATGAARTPSGLVLASR